MPKTSAHKTQVLAQLLLHLQAQARRGSGWSVLVPTPALDGPPSCLCTDPASPLSPIHPTFPSSSHQHKIFQFFLIKKKKKVSLPLATAPFLPLSKPNFLKERSTLTPSALAIPQPTDCSACCLHLLPGFWSPSHGSSYHLCTADF